MFKIRYVYDNPSCAGPFKGSATSAAKYSKGDTIYAVFGSATVISCRGVVECIANSPEILEDLQSLTSPSAIAIQMEKGSYRHLGTPILDTVAS